MLFETAADADAEGEEGGDEEADHLREGQQVRVHISSKQQPDQAAHVGDEHMGRQLEYADA